MTASFVASIWGCAWHCKPARDSYWPVKPNDYFWKAAKPTVHPRLRLWLSDYHYDMIRICCCDHWSLTCLQWNDERLRVHTTAWPVCYRLPPLNEISFRHPWNWINCPLISYAYKSGTHSTETLGGPAKGGAQPPWDAQASQMYINSVGREPTADPSM